MMRVAKGMTIDQVREIWCLRSASKSKAIMDTYHANRRGSGGREGLGIYGMHQERAAREKVRLAAKLLAGAGLDINYSTIRKITGQSEITISRYWHPSRPSRNDRHSGAIAFDGPPPIPFPGVRE